MYVSAIFLSALGCLLMAWVLRSNKRLDDKEQTYRHSYAQDGLEYDVKSNSLLSRNLEVVPVLVVFRSRFSIICYI